LCALLHVYKNLRIDRVVEGQFSLLDLHSGYWPFLRKALEQDHLAGARLAAQNNKGLFVGVTLSVPVVGELWQFTVSCCPFTSTLQLTCETLGENR
jgi:hypothetical protein